MAENTTPDTTSGPEAGPAQNGSSTPAGTGQGQQSAPVVDMPSYEADVEAMRAHGEFIDTRIDPHFESLINAASQQGMGSQLTQALAQAQEKVRNARAAVASAADSTVNLNQAVAIAHADARDAATNKAYYQPE